MNTHASPNNDHKFTNTPHISSSSKVMLLLCAEAPTTARMEQLPKSSKPQLGAYRLPAKPQLAASLELCYLGAAASELGIAASLWLLLQPCQAITHKIQAA